MVLVAVESSDSHGQSGRTHRSARIDGQMGRRLVLEKSLKIPGTLRSLRLAAQFLDVWMRVRRLRMARLQSLRLVYFEFVAQLQRPERLHLSMLLCLFVCYLDRPKELVASFVFLSTLRSVRLLLLFSLPCLWRVVVFSFSLRQLKSDLDAV